MLARIAALGLLASLAHSQNDLIELVPVGASQDDEFGRVVARDGDLVAVADPWTGDYYGGAWGRVLLYDASTGQFLHELLPDLPEGDLLNFGFDVDVHGQRVLVGAPNYDVEAPGETGAAYLYDGSSGQLLHKFLPPDSGPDFRMGRSVAMNDDWIAIGDLTNYLTDNGRVHVFSASSYAWVRTISAPLISSVGFGHSVALSGDRLVVGAPRATPHHGAAYVFDVPTGALQLTLDDPSMDTSGKFGWQVEFSENVVLLSAPGDDNAHPSPGTTMEGSAFAFDATTGQLLTYLIEPYGNWWFFAESIAYEDGIALVGSRIDDTFGENTGVAYAFEIPSGKQVHRFRDKQGEEHLQFGYSVAISGVNAVIGAIEQQGGSGLGYATYPSMFAPQLFASSETLSATTGGTVDFTVDNREPFAGHAYLILGSASGTAPAFPLDFNLELPLVVDGYTWLSLGAAGAPPFVGTLGLLDTEGMAQAQISFPPGLPAPLTLHHAAITFGLHPQASAAIGTSEAVALELVP